MEKYPNFSLMTIKYLRVTSGQWIKGHLGDTDPSTDGF